MLSDGGRGRGYVLGLDPLIDLSLTLFWSGPFIRVWGANSREKSALIGADGHALNGCMM